MATTIKGKRFDRDYFTGEKDYHLGFKTEVTTDYIRDHAEDMVEMIEQEFAWFEFEVAGIWYTIAESRRGVAAIWYTEGEPFGTWKEFDSVGDLCDWFDELAKKEA